MSGTPIYDALMWQFSAGSRTSALWHVQGRRGVEMDDNVVLESFAGTVDLAETVGDSCP
ncbi:hypothetical protein [Lentzea waywayandensis]|uniref:hypothetical protein n=1 Tax=Lentzea waywayandensis TaxID=84724 RepID=UPI0015A57022|nr:hypothetical protein [Lentzea waywayandensis]